MSTRHLLPCAATALLLAACGKTEVPPVFDGGELPDVVSVDRAPAETGSGPVDVSRPVDAGVADAGTAVDVQRPDVPPADVPAGATWCDLQAEPVPPGVSVPDGFCIRRFARIEAPRVMLFAPSGELFVTSPGYSTPGGSPVGRGAIIRFTDRNRDGVADTTVPAQSNFLGGLTYIHGILFQENELWYTIDNGVYALPYQPGDVTARTPVAMHRRIANLSDSVRPSHTLARAVDGSVYVSMGQYDTGTCPTPNARDGSVLRIGAGMPDNGQLYTSGFRNPMWLRCKEWGACYAAELTGDGWDAIGGLEKLVELRMGDTYGYPCCVHRGVPVPGVGTAMQCANVAPSVQTYTLHDTPFGFDWAPSTWPGQYGGSFFVGLHGWVGSWTNAGVQWAPVDPTTHRPTRPTEPFVRGFGRNAQFNGRISELIFAPDGRMFISDDQDGGIYWIAPVGLRIPTN